MADYVFGQSVSRERWIRFCWRSNACSCIALLVLFVAVPLRSDSLLGNFDGTSRTLSVLSSVLVLCNRFVAALELKQAEYYHCVCISSYRDGNRLLCLAMHEVEGNICEV